VDRIKEKCLETDVKCVWTSMDSTQALPEFVLGFRYVGIVDPFLNQF